VYHRNPDLAIREVDDDDLLKTSRCDQLQDSREHFVDCRKLGCLAHFLERDRIRFIDEQVSYRFRDVHDHLVRLADESLFFQDRITSLLDANLATVSNQLNTIMKIMTIIATVFMPLTFITGLYGMNVDLPHFGLGGMTMFWVLMGVMGGSVAVMLWLFHRRGWI
jgi:magnesium transporter